MKQTLEGAAAAGGGGRGCGGAHVARVGNIHHGGYRGVHAGQHVAARGVAARHAVVGHRYYGGTLTTSVPDGD